MSPSRPLSLSRRRALVGAGGLGLGLPVLAACGDDATTTASDPATSAAPSSPTSSAAAAPEPAPTSSAASGTTGVVSTADVPVGGGVVLADDQVVVTQPAEGEIKVFSSTCTHTGCPVSEVADGAIVCPCHGSRFDIATGEVLQGPASSALPATDFTVDGDQVVLS
ncbi:Rieske (2Fe-2S) protein [Nocardioides litoris]|uniref:Rieske (2Fe-2S) protein n=1 Tax=Nocardioides litoris TaxID=1926648 RepID=UPI001122EA2A|nr:Rieske (2Fe-2S) protein [Nocardioides litoris]